LKNCPPKKEADLRKLLNKGEIKMNDIEKIKKLREITGAGVMEVKEVLEEAKGDLAKAEKELMSRVGAKAAKKSDRNAGDGLIYSYIHNTGKIGSLLHMACETDFVAKTEDFKNLCKDIAMQVITDEYDSVEALLKADYMRDPSKKVQDIITEATAKLGEKLELKKFTKFSVNE
jgi:elongation factor Ts